MMRMRRREFITLLNGATRPGPKAIARRTITLRESCTNKNTSVTSERNRRWEPLWPQSVLQRACLCY
jgi:hypothetical protein